MSATVALPPPRLEPEVGVPAPRPRRAAGRWPWPPVALAAAVTAFLATGVYVPFLTPAAGFWLLVGLPAQMLSVKVDWPLPRPAERFCLAVAATLLGLMAIGLVENTVLPVLGVARPLDRVPVLVTADLVAAALLAWRPSRWVLVPRRRALGVADRAVLAVGALLVVFAVVGANRLNNGASGAVTVAMLVIAAGLVTFLLVCHGRLRPGTVVAAVYLVSLALLLMTSLRGWYVTGHDIQREYRVFELTRDAGRWRISSFRDAYNACLSITILPTQIYRLTSVDDAYVFKAFFQALFALCPVMVYLIASRFGSTRLALLGTVYFIAFPTYFTDMPFLDRQEIAFLFVGACLLVITGPVTSARRSRGYLVAFSLGMVLAHYSTTYIFTSVLLIAWLCRHAFPLVNRIARRRGREVPAMLERDPRPPVVVAAYLAFLLAAALLWSSVLTHTDGQLRHTVTRALASVVGASDVTEDRSSDTSYSLFGGHRVSATERLHQYSAKVLEDTAPGRADGDYFPLTTVDRYPVHALGQVNLPLSPLGKAAGAIGIDVTWVNSAIRQLSAALLQVFVCVGLVTVLLARRRREQVSPEFVALALGSFVVVCLQIVLPQVSVDYGLLRAFHQALFVLAPFLALGTVTAWRWTRRARFADGAATVFAVGFLLSLTGVVPQLLGGYPAQLHLNNAGQYYDIYYLQPDEVRAVAWLNSQVATETAQDVQSEVQTDRYAFGRIQFFRGVRPENDIFPSLVRTRAYVFIGYATARDHTSTVSYLGDLFTYDYPIAFLDDNKNLLYDGSGAQVYR